MRAWKSNPYVGLVLLLIALGAGWLTYRTVKSPGQAAEYSYVLKCTNPKCEEVFEASYPEGRKPPFQCPRCGEKTAFFLLQCRSCGRKFSSFNNPFQTPPYFCEDCRKRAAFPLEPGQVTPDTD